MTSFDRNSRIKAENGKNNIMFYCFEINECVNDILVSRIMEEGLLEKLRAALYPAKITYKKLFLDRKSREYVELKDNKIIGFCENKNCQEWGALFIDWNLDNIVSNTKLSNAKLLNAKLSNTKLLNDN